MAILVPKLRNDTRLFRSLARNHRVDIYKILCALLTGRSDLIALSRILAI
jgi:hypothetical protein